MNKFVAYGIVTSAILMTGCASSSTQSSSAYSQTASSTSQKASYETASKTASLSCAGVFEDDTYAWINFLTCTIENGKEASYLTQIYPASYPELTDSAIRNAYPDVVEIDHSDPDFVAIVRAYDAGYADLKETQDPDTFVKAAALVITTKNPQMACDVTESDLPSLKAKLRQRHEQRHPSTPALAPNETTPSPEENTPAPEKTPPAPAESTSGIRPEFQETMNHYLEFYRQYADFMKAYNNSSELTPEMMSRYRDMMMELMNMNASLQSIDQSELSTEELQLYIQTTAEVQNLLLSVE